MKLHEEFKVYEKMWESIDNFDSFDFDVYKAGTTTYNIFIDGSDKKAEGTYPGPEALRKILKFINDLTQEEKDNLGLGWYWDSEEPGDCSGDTIVYIVAPSEADEWEGRSGSNLPEAEMEIRKALGISLDAPNILMEITKTSRRQPKLIESLSELKQIIKEAFREELNRDAALIEATAALPRAVIDQLLASKLYYNKDFETACFTGDGAAIMQIIDDTMEEENLYTAGAKKLRDNIFVKIRGNKRIPVNVGISIFKYVCDSLVAAYGHRVIR